MQWVEFVNLGWWAFLVRWLHIISGVMWIGHLWYFNFTQTPTMPKIPAELRPAVKGWKETTTSEAIDLAKRCEQDGASRIIYTDIGRDGTQQGVNIDETLRIARAVHIPIIASGGVATLD